MSQQFLEFLPKLSSPTLIRATLKGWYDALIPTGERIHIVVDKKWIKHANLTGRENDEVLVLNISPAAARNVEFTDTHLEFLTRFSGREVFFSIPYIEIFMIRVPKTDWSIDVRMFLVQSGDGYQLVSVSSKPDIEEHPEPDKPKPVLRLVK